MASDVRLNTERIAAATRAIQSAWITAAHPMMRDGFKTQEYAEQAFRLAKVALEAADAVEHEYAESDCPHLSASGVSQHRGVYKVWRCDGCGWLYVSMPCALPHTFVPTAVEEALEELAAADAAGSWNDTERLRTALTDAAEMLDWTAEELDAARSALVEFGCRDDNLKNCEKATHNALRARDRVRAALAESVPSPPAEATQ